MRSAGRGIRKTACGLANVEGRRPNDERSPNDEMTDYQDISFVFLRVRGSLVRCSPRLPQIVEVDLIQPAIETAAGEELLVPGDVDDPAVLHHHDAVGQGQDRKTMRDDDCGAVADEFFQHFLNGLLAFKIHLAGGLVEDQDRGVAEDGPGQRNPLPLPAGEPPAERSAGVS